MEDLTKEEGPSKVTPYPTTTDARIKKATEILADDKRVRSATDVTDDMIVAAYNIALKPAESSCVIFVIVCFVMWVLCRKKLLHCLNWVRGKALEWVLRDWMRFMINPVTSCMIHTMFISCSHLFAFFNPPSWRNLCHTDEQNRKKNNKSNPNDLACLGENNVGKVIKETGGRDMNKELRAENAMVGLKVRLLPDFSVLSVLTSSESLELGRDLLHEQFTSELIYEYPLQRRCIQMEARFGGFVFNRFVCIGEPHSSNAFSFMI
jgi:hypothetical protein